MKSIRKTYRKGTSMFTAAGTKPVTEAHPDGTFMLGDIKVSPSHNKLWTHDRSIKLQPKVMAVLHYLARNHTRVISTEELIENLWAGRVVTHGSVQKSINALRGALNELIGDQELIVHYSKRGYQLTREPQFLFTQEAIESQNVVSAIELHKAFLSVQPKWRSAIWIITLLISLLIIYKSINWYTIFLPDNHKTAFQTSQGYTHETGHERNPTPHPDNKHLAYIRERNINSQFDENSSEIVIRNASGKDWRVAGSDGNWFKLAWSPEGKNLVAIEIKNRDGIPLLPRFYQPSNYLYSFHIFSLDLEQERLWEKQQLSQWQGRIFSVTWWDENTLEIVAKQGPNSGNRRYRYSLQDQQLTLLDELEGVTNPLASTVLRQKTAIASENNKKVRIDFLNARQKPINSVQLDVATAEISWIPDGSGILVYAEDERKLLAVYLNGKQIEVPLTVTKDKIFSHPHYSPDGNSIYYTEEKRSSNILLSSIDDTQKYLTGNTDLNYAASFAPDGEKIVYASVRNNQTHLWLIENGQEHQLTNQPIAQKIETIIWSDDGEYVVFNSGDKIYHQQLLTRETTLLATDTNILKPIAYFPATNRLLVIKNTGDARNLWSYEGAQQKQLTFGAIGSAIEYNGDVFFQYIGENGLWVLRSKDDSLERVTANINEYNKLLKANATGIYFMEGGTCHESDVYFWSYVNEDKSIFLTQPNKSVASSSFHINKGLLQVECQLPEANIVLLK